MTITLLDLLGILTFSIYGSYLAQRKGFDIFGIAVLAFVSSFGGGTLRDLLLNKLPIYFTSYTYPLMVVIGIIVSILIFKYFHKIETKLIFIDSIGLIAFAFIGAEHAAKAGLGLVGIVLLATMSAVGGGIIRDVMIGRIPEIFYQDFYATPAILLGIGYFVLLPHLDNLLVNILLILSVYIIRILAIHFKIQLWKPQQGN